MKQLFTIMMICLVLFSTGQKKYAVLICGETPTNTRIGCWNPPAPSGDEDEFWNDTFLMWEMLIELGYADENIFVFFGMSNQDWSTSHHQFVPDRYDANDKHQYIGEITDYQASESVIVDFFNSLANGNPQQGIPQLTENDFLLVWTFQPWFSNIARAIKT